MNEMLTISTLLNNLFTFAVALLCHIVDDLDK